MEDHDAHKIALGMYEPMNDVTIKEFQILQQRAFGNNTRQNFNENINPKRYS